MSGESPDWEGHFRAIASGPGYQRKNRKKLEAVGLLAAERDASVLDLCSGTGSVLGILREEGFTNVYGLDISASLLREHGKSYRVAVADCRQTAYRNAQFDYAIVLTSLHHLKPMADVERCATEVFRMLKPGGCFCIIDHHHRLTMRLALAVLFSPLSGLTPYTRAFRQVIENESDHFFYWLEHCEELFPILERLGFEIEQRKNGLFVMFVRARKPDRLRSTKGSGN